MHVMVENPTYSTPDEIEPNVKYAKKAIAKQISTKTAIKKSIAITTGRFVLGGLAARRV